MTDLVNLEATINSDREYFAKSFSKVSESINTISQNYWSGSSRNNFVSKVNDFLNLFDEPINSQLNSYAGAVRKFNEYKTKKEEKESIESQIINCQDDNEKKALLDNVSTCNEHLTGLKNEIEKLLSAIITSIKSGDSISVFADTTGLLGLVSTVGEAAKIPKNQRLKYLFPDGKPTTQSQARKYMTIITVKAYDGNGVSRDLKIQVHKKLAEEVKAVYNELYQIGFPVSDSASFCFRNMEGSSKLSHHSYGAAIDLNVSANGFCTHGDKDSKFYNNEKVVAIWKKHGFYWGGDWSDRTDPMHFTYTGS